MDIVEFVEKICGLELLEYQKEILREYEKKRDLYLLCPPYHGRTNFTMLRHVIMSTYIEQLGKGEIK